MRAAITGGAGFIGSHLADALVERGDEVAVLDDFSTGRRENVNPATRYVAGSVTDPGAVASALAGAEVVFHLAARGAVGRSIADPVGTNRVNVEGTLNVLVQARDAGVRRAIFASSSSVYGATEQLPTPEGAPLSPRSPYAVSKLASERYCAVFSDLFALETVVLRYFNVFGPRQRADSTYAAVIPRFASALLAGQRPTIHGDGTQSRDFTYVADVVAATISAAEAPAALSGSTLNAAPGQPHTVLELLTALGQVMGVNPDPIFTDPRPGDIRASWANSQAARASLRWSPSVTLVEGLRRYVAWLTSEKASSSSWNS
ncbi:MAG: NAD-dependent epimerase/dehydratase family protein [Actinobacteria bacterium]|nr:NAD-dependent epimerase/dehydratase family protein [Actinomycetota bacterium]